MTANYTHWPDRCVDKIRNSIKNGEHISEHGGDHEVDVPMLVYARIHCQAVDVDLGFMKLSRETISIVVVCIDLSCIFAFQVALWFLTSYVKLDSKRHRNLLFETQKFALEIHNLPNLTSKYPLFLLKAELWTHIETTIAGKP